ncbi:hypothetical protein AOXY_G2307 [Acipenser oxyrinchus oxyrinchus]|uniref:SWIM-type domain-containing protein n=1 Tax=Acipenser oxyrinchus oxyrinchus TaxID=40147 RepID=A0AAD8GHU6_ACIOX|nr:hypothetical protein AOXY_G2307 [Acipenser oxyrinchus oxyrinchus]
MYTNSFRTFMVDKDLKLMKSIKEVFPQSSILLCWFHVTWAVQRWITKKDSEISGPSLKEEQNKVMALMFQLKHCTTESQFQEVFSSHCKNVHPKVANYIKENWIRCGQMWSSFGRQFFHEDNETNNLAEQYFLTVKYQFLNGYANHRLDDLLLLLCRRAMEYYRYLDGLQEAGCLTKPRAEKESTGLRAAEELLQKGWIEQCHWVDDYRCLVPSTSRENGWYTVVLPEYTCECVAASNGALFILCKHLHIALEAAKQKGLDVDSMQKRLVQKLLQRGKTSQCKDMVLVDSFFSNVFSCIDVKYKKCSCIAASHGRLCICTQVFNRIFADTDVQHLEEQTPHDLVEACQSNATQQIIERLYLWSKGTDFHETAKLKQTLEKAQRIAFGSFESKYSQREGSMYCTHGEKNKQNRFAMKYHNYYKSKNTTKILKTENIDRNFTISSRKRKRQT